MTADAYSAGERGIGGVRLEGGHLMRTPRQLLFVAAAAMSVVAYETLSYPPEYLFAANLWAGLALFAATVALLCAVHPAKLLVSASGSILVAVSVGRSFALGREVLADDFPSRQVQGSFVIGTAIWAVVAYLLFIVWREYIMPWSVGKHR